MRKELTFFFILFLFSIALSSQPKRFPEKGLPFKYGKYFLYLDFHTDKATHSTILDFQLYDKTMHLTKKHQVIVETSKGKYGGIAAINEAEPGKETIEVSLLEDMFGEKGINVILNAEFKIIGRKEIVVGTPYDVVNLPTTPFTLFPTDHVSNNYGMFGCNELDGKLADGSVVYLNYNMTNQFAAGVPFAPKLKTLITATTLCFFQSIDNGHQLKWKLSLADKQIFLYRVYIFENELFLYTSYYVGNPKDEIKEQVIRKIDINTGNLIYARVLPVEKGMEFMLSNAFYDKATKELIFCGNYITRFPEKEYKNSDSKLSMFSIGKITADGECTIKEVKLRAEKPVNVNQVVLNIPFLCVKKLVKIRSGEYMVAAQYNYLLPYEYKSHCSNDMTETAPLKLLNAGLTTISFEADLDIVSQEINMLAFEVKRPNFTTNSGASLQISILGTSVMDQRSGTGYYWDPKTECLILTQSEMVYKPMDAHISLHILKVVSGEKVYFKAIKDINYNNKTVFGTYIMDDKTLLYYINDNGEYNLYTIVDL